MIDSDQAIQQRIDQLHDAGIKKYDQEILQSSFLFKRFMRTRRALESSYGESINSKKDEILKNLQDSIRSLNNLKFQNNNGSSFVQYNVLAPTTSRKLVTNNDDEVSKLIVASNVVDEIKLDLEEMIIIKVIENDKERCVTRTRLKPRNTRVMTSKSAPQSLGSGKGTRRGGGGGKGTRRVRWRRKRGGVSRKV